MIWQICVASTPHGRADSVINADGSQYFALPYEEQMPVQDFFARLHNGTRGEKMYAQAQNNRSAAPILLRCSHVGRKDVLYVWKG